MPILFSQVREDPMVEILAAMLYQKTETTTPTKQKAIVVGSGGCTALSLEAMHLFPSIEVVDMNIEQIYLVQLKEALCRYTVDLNDRLTFLENKDGNDKHYYFQHLRPFLLLQMKKEKEYTKEHDSLIAYWDAFFNNTSENSNNNNNNNNKGINQCGVFEQLFQQLQESNFDYDHVFSDEALCKAFGNDAVRYSCPGSFPTHFRHVMQRYQNMYKQNTTSNYFYHQFAAGLSYPSRSHPQLQESAQIPPYLKSTFIHNYKHEHEHEHDPHSSSLFSSSALSYYCSPLLEHLQRQKSNSVDLISLSNIWDWMSESKRILYNEELTRIMKPGGIVIVRKLNGDYCLNELIEQHLVSNENGFQIIESDSKIDASCFYNEVVILRKNSCSTTMLDVLENKQISRFQDLTYLIHNLSCPISIELNPFFLAWLQKEEKHMKMDHFIYMQQQFAAAINAWSQVLCLLASKLEDPRLRFRLMRNITEEHGHGQWEETHVQTFEHFLQWLQQHHHHHLDTSTSSPCNNIFIITKKTLVCNPVTVFIQRLMDTVADKSVTFSSAMLSMIELVYISISRMIASRLKTEYKDGTMPPHYSFHACIDYEHAIDLFTIAQIFNNNNEKKDKELCEGLQYGYYIFYQLYEGLYTQTQTQP